MAQLPKTLAKSFALTCFSALSLLAAAPACSVTLGGDILPSNTVLNGFSLTDVAKAIAPYQDTFDPALLPSTPFQLLTRAQSNYTVSSNTYFYVPIGGANDSPPILGTFPTNASQAAFYFFDNSQLGETGSITVDGQTSFLDASYLAGPVNVSLPNGGNNTLGFATFLAPFAPGTHTVSIQFIGHGKVNVDYCKSIGNPPGCIGGGVVYTVTSTAVPEPTIMLGMLVFGAALVDFKRRQKLSKSQQKMDNSPI